MRGDALGVSTHCFRSGANFAVALDFTRALRRFRLVHSSGVF
jgi:hypothetical protein